MPPKEHSHTIPEHDFRHMVMRLAQDLLLAQARNWPAPTADETPTQAAMLAARSVLRAEMAATVFLKRAQASLDEGQEIDEAREELRQSPARN